MKKIIFSMLLATSQLTYAGWVDLNTGINDDLTGVVFWGSNGVVSGYKGLYYTTTGGVGPASWTHYDIIGNTADSLVYIHTQFYHACADQSTGGNNTVFACGRDTISDRAVIMQFNFPSLTYSIIYIGDVNTSLKSIGHYWGGNYCAVGEDGLIVRFTSSSAVIEPTPFTHDLTSISFASGYFFLGANGQQIWGNDGGSGFVYNVIAAPGNNYKAVLCNFMNNGWRVGNSYWYTNAGSATQYNWFDYGTLNANCLMTKSSYHFVGTSHGIFRSSSSHSFLEYQPSSSFSQINCFWYELSSPGNFYACGNGGKLLLSTDNGGLPKPIAIMNMQNGGCVGSSFLLSAVTGTSTNNQWFVNGTPVYSGLGSYNYTFPGPGSYTVQVNVTNGPGSYDTAVQVVNIVPIPQINKPVTINDSILCHSEPIQISIDNTELNVEYILKKMGSPASFGTSPPGNGSTINFTSLSLNATGDYYFQAKNISANCTANFTTTFHIIVEQTDAKIHASKINVVPLEQLQFYQQCVDAQNYAWTFFPSATPSTSSLPDPTTNYGSLGSSQVKLVCWSDNGCYDSLITSGPMVYLEPTGDSCWNFCEDNIDGISGATGHNIDGLLKSMTGFYAHGFYTNPQAFDSRYGDSISLPPVTGGYIAKFNLNGVLKWTVNTSKTGSIPDRVYSAAENDSGHVYICGMSTGKFYDNTGDSVLLGDNYYDNGFIIKLDSVGRILWRMASYGMSPKRLTLDHAGNLIAGFDRNGWPIIRFNGLTADTLNHLSAPLADHGIMKISPGGQVLWDSEIYIDATNGEEITDIGVDAANNIYLTGIFEFTANFYSAGSSTSNNLPGIIGNYGGKLFLAKYNGNGNVLWKIRSVTLGPSNDMTIPLSMVNDDDGNSYISGRNSCQYPGFTHVFDNTDLSTTAHSTGEYFVAKVNNSGVCDWIQGASHSFYGFGEEILYDNSEVSVTGRISNNLGTTESALFTSANGVTKLVEMNPADFFVASYDTVGNLLRIVTSGVNSTDCNSQFFRGFFKQADGSYYLGWNANYFTGASSFTVFGTGLDSLPGPIAVISKFHESCGNVFYPCYSSTSLSLSDCDTVYSPSGGTYTSSGLYLDTLFTLSPICDTIYLMDIEVFHSSFSDTTVATCDSFVLNSITYNTSGTFQQMSSNSVGCDSTITLYLNIGTVDNGAYTLGTWCYANSASASSWQWMNCAGNIPISGATYQNYQPLVNGDYAVIVTENGCVDTSACLSATWLAIDEIDPQWVISMFPNPADGYTTISSNLNVVDGSIRLTDITGHIIAKYDHQNGNNFKIDLTDLSSGLYLIELIWGDLYKTIRLVKN